MTTRPRIRFFVSRSNARRYASENNGVFLIQTDMDAILHAFELGMISLITATLSSASTGWNVKRNDAIIEMDPECPDISPEVQQAKARILRVNHEGNEVVVNVSKKAYENTREVEHKALIRRMGMRYTEIPKLDEQMAMDDPKAVARMKDVIVTNRRVPSSIDLLNDFTLANITRMLFREDHLHEAVVCSARNRIFTLSYEKAWLAQKYISSLHGERADVYYLHPDIRFVRTYSGDTFIIDNRGPKQGIIAVNVEFGKVHDIFGGGEFSMQSEVIDDLLMHDDAFLIIAIDDETPIEANVTSDD